jgi:hypothetical protein
MTTKSRILYILCTLSLVLSVFLTGPDWVSCANLCPDEFMDLSFGPVEAVVEGQTQEVHFRHFFVYPLSASFFPLGFQRSPNTSFPPELVETPIFSEQTSEVSLRI